MRELEPEAIEAVLKAERETCNHPLAQIALDQTVESYPVIERPDASQLNRTIQHG